MTCHGEEQEENPVLELAKISFQQRHHQHLASWLVIISAGQGGGRVTVDGEEKWKMWPEIPTGPAAKVKVLQLLVLELFCLLL